MAPVAAVVAALAVVGCGTPGMLPAVAECPAATATPSVSPGWRTQSGGYASTVRAGTERLVSLREGLRKEYPTEKFPGDPAFRPRFATYADETVCAAEALKAVAAPPGYEGADQQLDAALDALIATSRAGREAVGKRNATEYHTWYREVDEKLVAVKNAAPVRFVPTATPPIRN